VPIASDESTSAIRGMTANQRVGLRMASNADVWYVRLPDGRVMRTRSTEAMRHFLKTGRIPLESRLRRPGEESWQPIERVAEFADLLESESDEAAARGKPRSGAVELRTLGVRGLVDELFNAFDSSLQTAKLTTAALTGLAMGIVLILGSVAVPFWHERAWIGYLGTGAALLVLFSICTSILTQLTALELSRFRPARFSEIRAGLLATIVRVTGALGLVSGSIVGVIVLLRYAPEWIAPAEADELGFGLELLRNVVTGTRLLLEVLCWPILSLAMLLLGPILIVEEYSLAQALREWLGMLRQHLGRIYLYQAIAFALAAVMTLPLLLPVLLAFGFVGKPFALSIGESVPFFVLTGIAMTPMLSYLLVAHVFIYLNLRYEFFYSARER
jgi:hypothetical protein